MEKNKIVILLVDDEEDILEFVGYNLKQEGYQIITSNNGADAIVKARNLRPHLILLDVMMPVMDGMETCRELKKIPELSETIIVFFTARGEDYSQITGLDAGADDYITKPIKPMVLVSKVNSLLRRHTASKSLELSYSVDEITIDKERYTVTISGKEIYLPRKEFELLALLTSKPNKVFTRDEIFSKVWSDDVIVGERTIDVHVRKIREKTGIEQIRTIKGVGYKFESV